MTAGRPTDPFMKVSWAGLGASVAAALLIGPLAVPARGAFSAPVKLSGTTVANAKAGIDSNGDAIAVWSHSDSTKWRVQERQISATGALGPVKTISVGGEKPLWPQIADDPHGGAIVVWTRTNGDNRRVEARTISAKGRVGPVKNISAPRRSARRPGIASDSRGNAIIVWAQSQRHIWRIKGRRISSKGVLGRVKTLSARGQKSDIPEVASDTRGDAIVVWAQFDGANWRIKALRITAKGRLRSVKTLSAPGHDAALPQVASDDVGDAVAVWSQFNSKESGRIIKARRISANGRLGQSMTVSPTDESSTALAQIASDARGDVTVAWGGFDPNGAQARQISATGVLGPTKTLSSPGLFADPPQIAVDGAGNTSAVWVEIDDSLPENWYLRARQISGTGALGPVQTLATSPVRTSDVAVNAEGDAFAAWSQLEGSTWREWASRGA